MSVAILIALNVLCLWAPGLSVLPKRLLRVYGCYMLLAFTAQALLLLALEPAPGHANFAVPALIWPTYAQGLENVLPKLNLGITLMLALVLTTGRRLRETGLRPLYVPLAATVAVYVVANLMRLTARTSDAGVLGSISARASLIGPTVIAVVVIGTDWRQGGRGPRFFLVIAALVECGWAVAFASKTPLLSVLLLFYLDPRRRKITPRAFALGAVAVFAAFTLIQDLKPTVNQSEYLEGGRAASFFVSLTNRFDGLDALTGAVVAGPGSYVTVGEVLLALPRTVLPQSLSGQEKELAGVRWGRQIYGRTNGTHYAEGLAAEGYAVAGWSGVVAWALTGGFALLAVAAGLASRRLPILIFSCAYASSSGLFERGLLGQQELLSNSFQGTSFILFAYYCSGAWLRRQDSRAPKPRPTNTNARTFPSLSSTNAEAH